MTENRKKKNLRFSNKKGTLQRIVQHPPLRKAILLPKDVHIDHQYDIQMKQKYWD